jgi:hypothetical protein
MISDMWNDGWLGRGVLLIFAIVALAIPALLVLEIAENREWERYSEAHACKVVAKVSGSTGTGIGTTVGSGGKVGVGPVVVSVAGKTGWLCDDGITYWR